MDDDSPYSFYHMSRGEQKQYVDEARKIALEMHNASEAEIAKTLAAAAVEFKKYLNAYHSTKHGKVKMLERKLSELKEQKQHKISYGIRKSLEVSCFQDYINMLSYDNRYNLAEIIEKHVDDLYRREDAINRMINDGEVENLTGEIIIYPNYRIRVNSIHICQEERRIWVEGKYPIKGMSKEKAMRFLSSAKKRKKETGEYLIALDKEIASTTIQLNIARRSADSNEAREERKRFNEASKKFGEKLNDELGHRIQVFLKSEKSSPFKEQVYRSLQNAQNNQIKKRNKPCELICPKTMLYLVRDVNNGKIKLPQGPGQEV